MSKLKQIKEKAFKTGQVIVGAGMLAGALLNTNPKPKSKIITKTETQSINTVDGSFQTMPEMIWLDEDNLIINNEILEFKEACAKYPNDAQAIGKFMQDNLHEKEAELIDEGAKGKWKDLSPEDIVEIEKRLQKFDINNYLQKFDINDQSFKNNEPTMER